MKQEHEQLLKNKMMRASLSDGKAQATRSHLKKSCERANKVRQEIQVREIVVEGLLIP